MTIEQLLGLSTADLEAMSDQQLEEHFAPLLAVSRPLVPAPPAEKPPKKKGKKAMEAEAWDAGLLLLEQHGIKL